MENIKGKVIVITGASSGLGEAAAKLLSQEGAKVVLGARSLDKIRSLSDLLNQSGDNSIFVATDVTKKEQVQTLVDAAVEKFGRIDVLINNAGLMPHSLLESLKVEDWNQMIDVHIKGTLNGIAAALPYMIKQKSGHVINVSSVAGHFVRPGSAVYSATKHAVRVISEGFRQEVKPHNIRSTIISPGAVATNLPDSITDPNIQRNVKAVYEKNAISSDSFARAVVFAISQPPDVDINEILFRPTVQEL